jgi:hypothetical protein
MATITKDFRVKAGLVVEGASATVEGHDILTKKIADAKGDLLVGTADNAISRLAEQMHMFSQQTQMRQQESSGQHLQQLVHLNQVLFLKALQQMITKLHLQ